MSILRFFHIRLQNDSMGKTNQMELKHAKDWPFKGLSKSEADESYFDQIEFFKIKTRFYWFFQFVTSQKEYSKMAAPFISQSNLSMPFL